MPKPEEQLAPDREACIENAAALLELAQTAADDGNTQTAQIYSNLAQAWLQIANLHQHTV